MATGWQIAPPQIGKEGQAHDHHIRQGHDPEHFRNEEAGHDEVAGEAQDLSGAVPKQHPNPGAHHAVGQIGSGTK
jgi:hypothetical protein